MINLLILALCNSLVISGLSIVTKYELDENKEPTSKMLLWRLRYWANKLPEHLRDPLLTCSICMASVHGTWFFWLTQDFTLHNLIIYPIYLLGVAGINSILKCLT